MVTTFAPSILVNCGGVGRVQGYGASSLWKQRAHRWTVSALRITGLTMLLRGTTYAEILIGFVCGIDRKKFIFLLYVRHERRDLVECCLPPLQTARIQNHLCAGVIHPLLHRHPIQRLRVGVHRCQNNALSMAAATQYLYQLLLLEGTT